MARTELTAEQLDEFNSYFRDLQADAKREGYEVDRDTELHIFIERIAFEAA